MPKCEHCRLVPAEPDYTLRDRGRIVRVCAACWGAALRRSPYPYRRHTHFRGEYVREPTIRGRR